jgi:RHS repeat-associated protein
MTFVSDIAIQDSNFFTSQLAPSGFLMLRDGTQYRIDFGYIQWMRDRNGNSIAFTYDNGMTGLVTGITSSLGETVTVAYGIQDPTLGKLDLITYKGFGGAQRTIKVLRGTNLDGALRDSTMSVQTPQQLFPEAAMNGADSQNNYDPKVNTQVILPDGRFYQFLYNPYGEIARVVMPTGGTIDYEMAPGSGTITDFPNCGPGECGSVGIYRTLQKRTVYPNGLSAIEGVTTYSQSITQAISTKTTIDHLGANGVTLLARDIHYFTGDPTTNLLAMSSSAQSSDVGSPNFYPTWNEGKEYQTDLVDPSLGTLKSITNTFQNRQHVAWFPWGYGTEGEPAEDPRLTDTTTTLSDTNEVAFASYQYDSFNNLTDTFQYDFGPQAHGGLIRHTQTQYVSDLNYTKPDKAHARNLPSIVKVFGTGSSPLAETDYEYDNYTPEMTGTVHHAHLTDRPGMVGTDATLPHASDFTPIRSSTAYVTRGNATAVTRQVFQDSKTRVSYTQFDIAGNPIAGIDPKGNTTTVDFSDRFGSPGGDPTTNTPPAELPSGSFAFAFPTKVTNPAGFISYTQYDYYIGRPVNSQDWNGNNSSASYSDLLDRQTNVTGASLSSTAITYLDSSHTIKVAGDRDSLGDRLLVTNTIYDGLGRTTETRLFETTSAYISTTKTYDAMGRPATVSNPHRTTESAAPTTTAYDGLSRPLTVTTFDGAVITSSYSGSTTTVTDQAGAVRDSVVDAADRLKTVTEHPGGMTTYLTTYGYDVLDDLTSVTQGTQTRTFGYNSVKELTSATNPENGTTGFTYDDNGNLFTRTDALSRGTTYTYDSLNRISTRTYSDTTPGVSYFYDDPGVSNSKGRLTKVTSSVSTYKYQAYDALGRVTQSTQSTGQDYTMHYAYDAAGQMTSETYPSGKIVDMTYDGAGRLSSVAKHLGSSYASGITYASHGAVSSMTLGNGLIEATGYNNRLQPTSIRLGVSTADPQSVLGLSFAYSTTGHNDNNGNVLTQTITANSGTVQIGLQTYSYDGANRLTGATETGAWIQTYDYDQFGNRAVRMGSYLPNSQLTPQSANATDFSAFGGSQTKNQITLTGFGYDAVGNLTGDPTTGPNAIVYDAENHQTSYTKSGTTSYAYDGDGNRVSKTTGSGTTTFVYNALGQLIAEYGGQATNGGTSYLTTDHLGSTRVVTNGNKGVVARHDYLPFGEELPVGTGNRTVGLGYVNTDDTKQKFTSMERDGESGLDFAQARYQSTPQGRFTSPDPARAVALDLPQSWNLYGYAIGNPLRFIDPDGLVWLKSGGDNPEYQWVDDEYYNNHIDNFLAWTPVQAGTVIYLQWVSGDYEKYAGLVGGWVTLGEGGVVTAAQPPDPSNITVLPDNSRIRMSDPIGRPSGFGQWDFWPPPSHGARPWDSLRPPESQPKPPPIDWRQFGPKGPPIPRVGAPESFLRSPYGPLNQPVVPRNPGVGWSLRFAASQILRAVSPFLKAPVMIFVIPKEIQEQMERGDYNFYGPRRSMPLGPQA